MNLNVFMERILLPNFSLKPPEKGEMETMTVSEDVSLQGNVARDRG